MIREWTNQEDDTLIEDKIVGNSLVDEIEEQYANRSQNSTPEGQNRRTIC